MSPRRSRVLLAGLLAATVCSPILASPALAQAKPAAPAAPAAPQPAAITPSHLALAKEVMLSSGIARSFDSILPAFGEQIKQAAVTRPELTKDLAEVIEKMQPELELQKQRIIDTASRIYANKLTEAELRDIATFFRSASGKRYVETQPQVLDDMVQAMQTWTQEVSEYMMVRVRAEMGKRGHQLQ
ncbi:DUF2059 domain-containing protein [Methylobacterium frigidaeris]|uniref:DUF2059 domain-containing protein n=1 Tax=Methylobacterium frigidaeris TaxID=2038277 RepID=A0AA37HEH0_9HYPH|nr:DUF2059 domain-containing protein [Methylobacterium frigidaeris]PIK70811.1 hypothetical protein CS379_22680 [Methylobacterium frigidaeris]GJD64243.1 hypothetical protein MPEAHAMD_4423 [Methylobacterium frigidaeris]